MNKSAIYWFLLHLYHGPLLNPHRPFLENISPFVTEVLLRMRLSRKQSREIEQRLSHPFSG